MFMNKHRIIPESSALLAHELTLMDSGHSKACEGLHLGLS